MGGCVSSTTRRREPCASLVSLAGELREYPVPVTVSQVLHCEASSPDSFFVCDSDRLNFDDFIPPLDLQIELKPAQIYFLLPVSELQRRLAPSDMAALAVKASVALDASSSSCRRNRKVRISPVFEKEEESGQSFSGSIRSTTTISGSGSVRNWSPHRVKLPRIRLSSIAEGSDLPNSP